MKQVKIFHQANNVVSDVSLDILKRHNIPYQKFIVGTDIEEKVLLDKFPEADNFPIIVVDNVYVSGYTALQVIIREHLGNSLNGPQLLVEG